MFPLLPRDKKPYKGSHGFKDATTSERQICHWWMQTPEANLAVATGADAGVVALDVDPRHGGDDSLKALEGKHGPLPATVESATGGGGRHLLFQHPGGRVRNSSGKISRGLDIKSDGGYIVLPPSVHPDTGALYEWVHEPGTTPYADPPSWMIEPGLQSGTEETLSSLSSLSLSVTLTIEDVLRLSQPTGLGQRHSGIMKLARGLKAIPEYADSPVKECEAVVRRWHRSAMPFIVNGKAWEDTWLDFIEAWPNVKHPLGTGPMVEVLQRAEQADDPPEAERYDASKTRLLIKLCRELQRQAAAEPFYLACRLAGQLIGVDHMTAARRLKVLVADGLIKVVEPGTKKRATRYRWTGSDL